MHTFISDGTPSPSELVQACLELNLDEISITDHDSIGAYPEVLDLAKKTSLRILPGAELDCTYGDLEIHMLALDLDIQHEGLNRHLKRIQAARKERAREQADAINRFFSRSVIDLEKICSNCQTFMNPHLIHAMIDQHFFDDVPAADRYKHAQKWMKENIQVESVIEKPTAGDILKLIHDANGFGVLAHPGYYFKNGHDIHSMISDLKDMEMDGIEVTYPYFQEGSREFPTPEHEKDAVAMLRDLARRYGLIETTGSDAHQLDQLRSFHNRT